MKIAVVIRDFKPDKGGAASLLDTIKKGMKHIKNADYEFVVVYEGGPKQAYKSIINGMEYYNLFYMRTVLAAASKVSDIKTFPRKLLYRLVDRKPAGATDSYWDLFCDKEGVDLIWFTSAIQERTSVPYIFTVWDLAHRGLSMLPEVGRPVMEWKERENIYREMLYRASFILTANESGKREIVENYYVSADKIRIVPFPLTEFCRGEEAAPEVKLPEEYYFYPAQFWPHKNHIRILKALRLLKEENGIRINVVFTGSDKGNCDYIKKKAAEYGIDDQISFLGLVSYPELKYLYKHAKALLYASVLGPNNMPPYEAVYLGCPVIISGIPGHREQMKDAAIYFDPLDERSLAQAVMEHESGKKAESMKKSVALIKSEIEKYDLMEKMDEIFKEFQSYAEMYD